MVNITNMIWFPKEVNMDSNTVIRIKNTNSLVVDAYTRELVYNSAVRSAGYEGDVIHTHRPLKEGDIIAVVDPEFARVKEISNTQHATWWDVDDHAKFVERKKLRSAGKRVGLPAGLGYLTKYLNSDNIKALVCAGADNGLFDVVNDRLKYFDSEGVYGISSRDIKNAWYKSGCGVSVDYFENMLLAMCGLIDAHGRIDGIGASVNIDLRVLPRKWLSTREVIKHFTVASTLVSNGVAITTRLLNRLVSLSYVNREVIIDYLISTYGNDNIAIYENLDDDNRSSRDYRRFAVYSQKHVKWELLKQPMRVKVGRLNDKAYQWFWYANRLGLSLDGIDAGMLRQLPSPMKLSKVQLTYFIDNMVADNIHYNIGLVNLVTVFGNDIAGIKRVICNIALGSVFTSTKGISNMSKSIRNEFKALILRDVRFANIVRNYVMVRDELGRTPKSYEEAVVIASAFEYDNVLVPAVAVEASKVGINQELFEDIQKLHVKLLATTDRMRGQCTSLPTNVKVSGSYTVRYLDKLDPRGWFLGDITNCCQTVGNVGSECAVAGMKDSDKGFLVVEDDKGTIIAQSWTWVDTKGNLVLDSIESKGLSSVQLYRAADVIKEWSVVAKQTLFVDKVLIGKTNYGITKDIRKRLQIDKVNHHNKPQNYSGYMDGKTQREI